MKSKILYILIIAVILACVSCAVFGEDSGVSVTSGEEWSWDTGAYNTFEGWIELAEFSGRDLTIRMSTDLPYNTDTEKDSMPVFTELNHRRITMVKQTDSLRCTSDSESTDVSFAGRLSLPGKKHVNRIRFDFHILDENGNELKSVSAVLSTGGDYHGAFYIPADIDTVTMYLGIAAAAIWAAVILRAILTGKKKRTGE